MTRHDILGVPVDTLSAREALERIAGYFRMPGQFHVTTPNPEMIVEAKKNEAFRNVLQKTALNIPDGVGLVWAVRRRSSSPVERITGTDTLLALAAANARICPPERIFLLGAAPGVAERAAEKLKERNPAIRDIGTYSGSPRLEEEAEIIRRINAFSPTLLFVAFGAPKQDLWIARNLSKMPSVKVAMGIGGALDFIAGKRKRAPRWMRHIGIEWLWRLILEPRRALRIWRAIVVFPWLVLRERHPE